MLSIWSFKCLFILYCYLTLSYQRAQWEEHWSSAAVVNRPMLC